ncbi:heparinase II/III family protein [uncultured Cyclobacterium sp.]|uniref:heparinase II/III domain-containing protein n=1 Tax=uncultured Cyclobacterium sp. TaxID=453820 RepID=UPI0030EDD869|tara:strand:- start:5555 stop:7507 length:1953 start_codon:yes stop_codon:yes gene_type:complete
MIKYKNIFLLISGILLSANVLAQHLVSGKYSEQELAEVLIPLKDWKPFPALDDREAWSKADKEQMEFFLDYANENIDYSWPYIPATKSLLIHRNGNRTEYQQITFEKRRILGAMILAELYENKGRFIDPIVNGVWSICEESFWGIPAHLPKSDEYSGLMDVSKPFVDLFVAETATYLAWADYFFGEKFDEISPQIRKRIRHETTNRVFEPLMNQHHGWMSANENGRPPNNWNPWICSNWINTALLLEDNEAKRVAHVNKAIQVLDEFLTPYPEDGGCDEGPGYWGAAAASLFDNLSLLNEASNGAFQFVFEDEKVKNMGRFIYRAQISDKYFLNFADASPTPKMAGAMIYRYGKAIQDPDMMKFGAYYIAENEKALPRFHYFRHFFEVFMHDELAAAEKGLPLPKDVWLKDIQVMVARDHEGSTDGFFLAAKGGHNDESHNQNDIGNYVVYYDGNPLLIDVGSGTYTRRTFSGERYSIWFNRSDYHNIPTINGATQNPGMKYRASKVSHEAKKNSSSMSLDISKAYPESSGLVSYKRDLSLDRGKKVTVRDQYQLSASGALVQHLMTIYPVEVLKPGVLSIAYKGKDGQVAPFEILYNPKNMEVEVEKMPYDIPEDEGVKEKWGENIYRINLSNKGDVKAGKMDFTIRQQ